MLFLVNIKTDTSKIYLLYGEVSWLPFEWATSGVIRAQACKMMKLQHLVSFISQKLVVKWWCSQNNAIFITSLSISFEMQIPSLTSTCIVLFLVTCYWVFFVTAWNPWQPINRLHWAWLIELTSSIFSIFPYIIGYFTILVYIRVGASIAIPANKSFKETT